MSRAAFGSGGSITELVVTDIPPVDYARHLPICRFGVRLRNVRLAGSDIESAYSALALPKFDEMSLDIFGLLDCRAIVGAS
jgi:hypothetical protein